MDSVINLLDYGFSCLVEKMGIVNAERFISIIKQDDFDYTTWQREYFDRKMPGEIMADAAAYAQGHPHSGQGKRI